ncbi:hypothetical protein AO366_1404 [Moraxella catarrhalis]|nr:hypothetical protein AO368_1285 [Moraxella catarrhalis]OAV32994.1 hypothetical protein AO366_1404 [Moraxella catarrhalis]OAV38289.1 hypothetical protein AO365_0133 [Moraxella catarrhalis]
MDNMAWVMTKYRQKIPLSFPLKTAMIRQIGKIIEQKSG